MHAFLKHKLLIGATALAAAAFAGGAYAATQSATSSRQAFLNDVAKRLNVTPQQLTSAIKAAFLDRLDAAVKAGALTQAQADRIRQRIEQGAPVPFGLGPRDHPPGGGPYLAPRVRPPRGDLGAPRLGPGGPLAAAARYLGLTDAQLWTDLGSGRTLAQIARARGKSVSGLQQAMMASLQTRLDQAVAAGRISKAQEQRLLQRLSARIGQRINRVPEPPRGPGPTAPPATLAPAAPGAPPPLPATPPPAA